MTTIQVTKETGYAVMGLDADKIFATKIVAYAIMGNPPTPPGHQKVYAVIN